MKKAFVFDWSYLGDIDAGRENLGANMPVFVYRLFEYTMREAIAKRYGEEVSIAIFRDAGRIAGSSYFTHFLADVTDMAEFVSRLQQMLSRNKIGILRIENVSDCGDITLTVSEDLDCSGLPVLGETVCHYDEGFIAGVFSCFFKREYSVEEIDCWAKGDRVCRFEARVKDGA